MFFDSKGVIHHKYVSEGRTVNATFYVQVLDHLCMRIAHVRPEMWRARNLLTFCMNANPGTKCCEMQKAKKGARDPKKRRKIPHYMLFAFHILHLFLSISQ